MNFGLQLVQPALSVTARPSLICTLVFADRSLTYQAYLMDLWEGFTLLLTAVKEVNTLTC